MAQDQFDVIVVGARCAGSPTAMLLARNGYRVLVLDRAKFPSDTLSTHVVHPKGEVSSRVQREVRLDREMHVRPAGHLEPQARLTAQ